MSEGAATFGSLTSLDRLIQVLYRAPHAERWEERPLGWAMDRIDYLVKRTRDESFVRNLPDGTPVNHTLGVASPGGATLDNGENCLIKKLFGAASAWFGSRTRRGSDTAPPSQVWARATEGERQRSRNGTWPMRTASS
jgi:formate dehydrogenase major subunit